MTESTFLSNTSPERISKSLERNGYVIIERLAPSLVAQSMTELEPHLKEANSSNTYFEGEYVRNLEGLVGRSKAAEELMIHPMVLAIADLTLLPYCVRYQLNWTSSRQLEPGALAQTLHRDGQIYPFSNPHPPTQLAAMWAGSHFTVANGGTLIVPGSHLWSDDRKPAEGEVINTEMSAGSVLLYTSGTLHGGGKNGSTEPRTGIAIHYSLGWLRQEENLHLELPPPLALHLPEKLQQLIGYDFGAPYLGFAHGDDPGRLVGRRTSSPPAYTRPEIDEAAAKLAPLKLGSLELE